MKNTILLHIPHSCLKLTREFNNIKKYISIKEIKNFNITMTDLFTDKLFSYKKFKYIKPNFSRICCDVEKFADDKQEEMSKYGMGVIYSKTNERKKLISIKKEYKETILKKYYYPYHKRLDNIVDKYLAKNRAVILIDCHSFAKDIIMNDKTEDLPDICIGSNEFFDKDLTLLNVTNEYFKKLGYNTSINYPYSGSMIPNKLIKSPNKKFASIMLELNKNLYLEGLKRSKNFSKVKKDLFNYLTYIKNYQL